MKRLILIALFACVCFISHSQSTNKVTKFKSSICRLMLKDEKNKWQNKDFTTTHLLVVDYSLNKVSVYEDKLVDDIDMLPGSSKTVEVGDFSDYVYNAVDISNKKCILTITLDNKNRKVLFLKQDFGSFQKIYFID